MENVIFYKFRKSNNNWIIAFLNNETNNYTIIKNDINSLKEFLDNQKSFVFIGANNSIYDDIFITSLLKNGNLFDEVNKEDIEETLPITFDVTEGIVRNNLIDFNNMVSCLWDKDNKPLLYNYSYKEEDIETQLKKDLLIIQSFYQDNERNNYINWKKEVIEEFNLPKSAYRESYGYIMKQIVGLEINESSSNSNNITLDSRLDKTLKEKNDPFLNQLLNILMYYYSNTDNVDSKLDKVLKEEDDSILNIILKILIYHYCSIDTVDPKLDKILNEKNDPFLNQLLNILMYYYNNTGTIDSKLDIVLKEGDDSILNNILKILIYHYRSIDIVDPKLDKILNERNKPFLNLQLLNILMYYYSNTDNVDSELDKILNERNKPFLNLQLLSILMYYYSNTDNVDSELDKVLKEEDNQLQRDFFNKLVYYYKNINTLEKQKIKLDNCFIKFELQGILGSMDSDYIDTNITDDIKYLYIDFNSFGPNILINNKWLDQVAKNPSNYELVKNRRIDLKGKKDIKQLYYKYLLNSGLDYLNKVKTKNGENIGLSLTITGIMTMMLLYSNIKPYGIELIECNTDGFIVKCPSKYIDKVKLEVKKIEKELSLSCDVDIVDKIAHFNTQNYVMQYENGSEKHLGYFGNAQTHPLYCSGITAVETALKEYYLNGIPVSVTLRKFRNENNLKAFQIIKKPKSNENRRYINDGGLYYPYDRTSYRLFAVREDTLKTPLYTKNKKEKYEIDKKKRGKSVKDGFYYFELSDNHIPNIYDIDLNYYIDECYKVINAHPVNKEIQIMKPKQKKFCFVDIDGTLIKNKDEITSYTIFSNAAKELVKDEELSIAYNLFNKQKGCYLLQFLSLCKSPRKPGSLEDYFAEFLKSKNLFPGKTTAEYKLFVKRFLENDKEFSKLLSTYTYAKELLVYLKNEDFYNCINSNWFKSVQSAKLESTGLDEYIDDICTIDDHQAKPSLAGWKELLNNHNVSSDDFVISLGDTTSDIVPKTLNIPSVIIDHDERKLSQRVLSNGIIINDFSEIMNPNFYSEIDKIKKYRRN